MFKFSSFQECIRKAVGLPELEAGDEYWFLCPTEDHCFCSVDGDKDCADSRFVERYCAPLQSVQSEASGLFESTLKLVRNSLR